MQIDVRPACEADVPALLDLYAELHPADLPPATQTALDVWRAIEAQSGRTILVAQVAATVAGTVDCAVLPNLTRGARPFMLVENIVVSGECRRAGRRTRRASPAAGGWCRGHRARVRRPAAIAN